MRNLTGIKAYQKAGFNEIGRRRECRMMGGKLWNEVYMDCLSSEFERPVTSGKGYRREARRRLRSVPTTAGVPLNVGGVYRVAEAPGHGPVPGLPRCSADT
jgi:hypothetical protein